MTLTPDQLEKLVETQKQQEKELEIMSKAFSLADISINKPYLDSFSDADIWQCSQNDEKIKDYDKLRIYKLSKFIIDKNEDVNDKLTSVYNSLYNLAISVAIFIVGTETKVDFYFVTRSEILAKQSGEILEAVLRGNFPGIDIEPISPQDVPNLLEKIEVSNNGLSMKKSLATVSIIPSLRNKDKKEQYVQGIEKFVDALRGRNYVAILLGTPLSLQDINIRKHGYEKMYSFLTPYSKFSISYGENVSTTLNESLSKNFTKSINDSISDSNSNSSSNTSSHSSGSNSSFGSSGRYFNFSDGTSSSYSDSYTSGISFSHTVSQSIGTSQMEGVSKGKTLTEGTSETKTINFENKSVSNLLKKIEDQIERIKTCESYGLWESCAYFFSDDIGTSVLAATTYKSIMAGEKTGIENAHVNIWSNTKLNSLRINTIFENVKYLVHPCVRFPVLKERSFVTPTTLVSGSELSFLLGMPRKPLPGLVVQEMAEFGRSVTYENRKPRQTISIGNIYHMGVEDEKTPVEMDLDLFSSHCFITGSSGSGKSYATYNLLDKLITNGIKILIIEPAKGEYKTILGNLKGIKIFTTELNRYRFLKINPFKFPEQIHILAHIEQLMQIFGASWSLYDAMPAILKESIVQAYVQCGWDIRNSTWITGVSSRKYPLFSDILGVLPQLIDASDYSDEVKGNYKGALISRLHSMTTGLNGLIFEKDSVNDETLFDNNVIIDLSEIGSEETIALLMGTLIMKLNEHRKARRKAGHTSEHDSLLHHVTVLEEAHNLLKKTNKDQSQDSANMVGKSVAMISNSIKEMRTYGEGFLIIDQSPLAIDSSAVENSATKIIMNTPSKEASEVLGSALSLNEKQTKELSRLNVGVAAVMQKNWMTPVLMKVGNWNANKYEAALQEVQTGLITVIRSELTTELCKQITNNKFSAIPLTNIINGSRLSSEQKEELMEIVYLFNTIREKERKLSDSTLGFLFTEIIGCKELFNIIPHRALIDVCEGIPQSCESEEGDEFAYHIQALATKWIELFKRSLAQYIRVEYEDIQTALHFMLAYKKEDNGELGEMIEIIYTMLTDGSIDY